MNQPFDKEAFEKGFPETVAKKERIQKAASDWAIAERALMDARHEFVITGTAYRKATKGMTDLEIMTWLA